jgi:hypothetical protein
MQKSIKTGCNTQILRKGNRIIGLASQETFISKELPNFVEVGGHMTSLDHMLDFPLKGNN